MLQQQLPEQLLRQLLVQLMWHANNLTTVLRSWQGQGGLTDELDSQQAGRQPGAAADVVAVVVAVCEQQHDAFENGSLR